MTLQRVDLPEGALLALHGRAGAYVDCYVMDVPGSVSLADFVEAFTTSWLFRLERTLLGLLASRPSTDDEAAALAQGSRDRFAAWGVEARREAELVLAAGRTRSWYSVAPLAGGTPGTRLLFGSAVLPRTQDGQLGLAFHILLPFHRVYSRCLLSAAARRLTQR